jgi:hypothetical protein
VTPQIKVEYNSDDDECVNSRTDEPEVVEPAQPPAGAVMQNHQESDDEGSLARDDAQDNSENFVSANMLKRGSMPCRRS